MSRYTARHALLLALTFVLCCIFAAMAWSEPEPEVWPSYPGDNTVVTP